VTIAIIVITDVAAALLDRMIVMRKKICAEYLLKTPNIALNAGLCQFVNLKEIHSSGCTRESQKK